MNNKNLISVIMPVHNTEKYLKKSLDSLLSQDYQNFELCLAFDNCSDGSFEVFKSHPISTKSKWLVCDYRQPAATRNAAIRLASGEFLAYLDSDDWWEPSKLSKCLSLIESEDAALVWHDEIYVDAKSGVETPHRYRTMNRYFPEMLWRGNCISTSAVMHKNFFKTTSDESYLFDENKNFRGVEDFKLWLGLAKKNMKFAHIPEFLGYYLIHEASLARNKVKMYQNVGMVIDSELKELKSKGRFMSILLALPYRARVSAIARWSQLKTAA